MACFLYVFLCVYMMCETAFPETEYHTESSHLTKLPLGRYRKCGLLFLLYPKEIDDLIGVTMASIMRIICNRLAA